MAFILFFWVIILKILFIYEDFRKLMANLISEMFIDVVNDALTGKKIVF